MNGTPHGNLTDRDRKGTCTRHRCSSAHRSLESQASLATGNKWVGPVRSPLLVPPLRQVLCFETSRASSETYEMERPDVDLRSLDEALERAVIGPLGVRSDPTQWH